jgi:hypothetical protein
MKAKNLFMCLLADPAGIERPVWICCMLWPMSEIRD